MALDQNALGVDVSLWQKTVDWPALKAAGAVYAFIKATENINILDPFFVKNWTLAKGAGLYRGAYHFFRPAQEAKRQAAWFVQACQGDYGELPLALDVESNGGLGPAALAQAVQTCLTEIEALCGRRPLIYTGPGFWNSNMAVPAAPAWTGNYYLWIAHYTKALQPLVPRGWNEWTFWQYTDQGKLPGIPNHGNVDLNRFKSTPEALAAWVQAQGWGGPLPLPEPNVSPEAVIQKYFDALNRRDVEALLALYHPNAVHTTATETLQGLPALRAWYLDWLGNKLPGGQFQMREIYLTVETGRLFRWTCACPQAEVLNGEDTMGLRDGKIQYHATTFTVKAPG